MERAATYPFCCIVCFDNRWAPSWKPWKGGGIPHSTFCLGLSVPKGPPSPLCRQTPEGHLHLPPAADGIYRSDLQIKEQPLDSATVLLVELDALLKQVEGAV